MLAGQPDRSNFLVADDCWFSSRVFEVVYVERTYHSHCKLISGHGMSEVQLASALQSSPLGERMRDLKIMQSALHGWSVLAMPIRAACKDKMCVHILAIPHDSQLAGFVERDVP